VETQAEVAISDEYPHLRHRCDPPPAAVTSARSPNLLEKQHINSKPDCTVVAWHGDGLLPIISIYVNSQLHETKVK
jgi:hypothetical protein